MNKQEAEILIKKYLDGSCTDEEYLLVSLWYKQEEEDKIDIDFLDKDNRKQQILATILLKQKSAKVKSLWFKFSIAASILLAVGFGFMFFKESFNQNTQKVTYTKDVLPGKTTGSLTLSNGSVITLNTNVSDSLINDDQVSIRKTKDGLLVYTFKSDNSSIGPEKLAFNTLRTPNGGQFAVELSDGTKVWLNASSTLKFPVNFLTKRREVELQGEGYFEVAKDAKRPFTVKSKNQTVEVLGTHFNVKTYDDEPMAFTTLMEGKVKIVTPFANAILKPGEQAYEKIGGNSITIKTVDVSEAIAWKNGLFAFNGADITTIMKQMSRWYDVTVAYEGKMPKDLFTGKIDRNANLSESLQILSSVNVRFKIEGRKVTVLP